MLEDPLLGHRKTQLVLKIISGQQLPKPKDSMFGDRGEVRPAYCRQNLLLRHLTPAIFFITKKLFLLMFFYFQIIDPFVEVEIIGLPVDCSKQQTRVVDDNGLCSKYTLQYNKKKTVDCPIFQSV